MTMISQSSFMSASSKQTLGEFNNDLYKIEADVFNKVVNLKSEKIQCLTQLSDCIDRKYHAESELIHQLQIKKRKQQNLATKAQYEPIIYRNVDLKAEEEELARQVMEKALRSANPVLRTSGVGSKSRARSVLELSRAKDMYKSSHSRGKNTPRPTTEQNDYEDELIDQIIEQRKANNSLSQIIREEQNSKLEMSVEQEINIVRQKITMLQALLRPSQQRREQKLSKSIRSSASKISASRQSKRQSRIRDTVRQDDATPVTNSKEKSENQLIIQQLLEYIQEEQEQKKLLYEDLLLYQEEMEDMRNENEEMKKELAARNVRDSRNA